MSTTVCLTARTMHFPEGGGHQWVYLNWALGFRAVGCNVIWLEELEPSLPAEAEAELVLGLKCKLAPYGLSDAVALYSPAGEQARTDIVDACLNLEHAAESDLLVNLHYGADTQVVHRFRRSALLDIDPGLLQLWISESQIQVAPHDLYFSTGETVGRPEALFPDCGIRWNYIPPAVFLPEWPETEPNPSGWWTTVSDWWGDEWVVTREYTYNNEKRISFLDYAELPGRTGAHLEIAAYMGPGDEADRELMGSKGWHIVHSAKVSRTPDDYRRYIQQSKGEFSCAKPSCMKLQNAWISDRTLCYLASGKPAVVQHTGTSRFLPDAEGLFRFRNIDEAARYLDQAEADYEVHAGHARALAEEYFDARKIAASLLERALA